MTEKRNLYDLVSEPVSLNDTLHFHCTKCGKCCRHREDVLLNARDVWQISGFLKLSPKEMIEKYCKTYLGINSRVPIVTLLPIGQMKLCPFLQQKTCSIHRVKPSVCKLYPLGRFIDMEKLDTEKFIPENMEIQYIYTGDNCDGIEKNIPQITVEEWLKDAGISHPDIFFVEWTNLICMLALRLPKLEREQKKKGNETALYRLWVNIYSLLYQEYDNDVPFEPQFQQNKEYIQTLLTLLPKEEEV